MHEIGSSWKDVDDVCYQFKCEVKDEAFTTVAVKRDCPYLNPKCPPEEIVKDKDGCCDICNITIPPEG